jgi:hypothetical protein
MNPFGTITIKAKQLIVAFGEALPHKPLVEFGSTTNLPSVRRTVVVDVIYCEELWRCLSTTGTLFSISG